MVNEISVRYEFFILCPFLKLANRVRWTTVKTVDGYSVWDEKRGTKREGTN